MIEMNADMKVQTLLYGFEREHGIRPNRIIMGWHLANELRNQFYYNYIPIRALEELAEMRSLGVTCEYEGIPIKIDYDNPNILEVGYMVNWLEPKKG